jgi:hypothetical protein
LTSWILRKRACDFQLFDEKGLKLWICEPEVLVVNV